MSTGKKAVAVGGVVLVLLLVIGALAGPRRDDGVPAAVVATPTATSTIVATPSATNVVTPSPSPAPTPSPEPTVEPTENPTPPADPTVDPTLEPTREPTEEPIPTAEPEPESSDFYDGLWEVGVDIEPGTYRTTDDTSGCYWARLSGFSGDLDEIISNNFGSGYQVVTIAPRDVAFESNDCGDWTSDLSQVTDSDTEFGEGTLIVGTDIRPGTYRSSEGDGCYWARLRGFNGRINDVIANDFRDSPAIVNIRASDEGFTSNGCGTWTLR